MRMRFFNCSRAAACAIVMLSSTVAPAAPLSSAPITRFLPDAVIAVSLATDPEPVPTESEPAEGSFSGIGPSTGGS